MVAGKLTVAVFFPVELRRPPSSSSRHLPFLPICCSPALSSPHSSSSDLPFPKLPLEAASGNGGHMVAELVGAFNELTHRMGAPLATSSSSRLLFLSLKLALPALQSAPPAPDGRPRLARALAVAFSLADLQMDAEIISCGILREAVESGSTTIVDVRAHLGAGIAHLLHECARIKNAPSMIDILDDESAGALRKFCIAYYDIRVVILELALELDAMRHLGYLPRYQQQIASLRAIKISAPLAHAVGAVALSSELEDLSFRHLFPSSYSYVDAWLAEHEADGKHLLDAYRERLRAALAADDELKNSVDSISVQCRYKSQASTMKKILSKSRNPGEVNDILGMRVVLGTNRLAGAPHAGTAACYRALDIIRSMWPEAPSRTKDYIAAPKGNGYMSLHVVIDVSEPGKIRPTMEIQIRTEEMDKSAVRGDASHNLYKGGFTDPQEAKRLKAIMMAAAEVAAFRLRDLPSGSPGGECGSQAFCLLDKNGDGRISMEELVEVMRDLGSGDEDAAELMRLLDANSDGSLSAEEFESFQRQVEMMRRLDDRDRQCRALLREKLVTTDNNGGLIQVYRKQLGDKLLTR